MSTLLHGDSRCNAVLNAALSVFARYGFKRVSMDDIASEAGISRPSLYLIYANKAAIFNALAETMAARACEMSTAAWPNTEAFSSGLGRAAMALHLEGWRLVKGSPHGSELLAENSGVVGDIVATIDRHFIAMISERLIENGQSGDMAKTIAAALHGIKEKSATEDELFANTFAFAKMVAASFGDKT